MNLFQQSIVLIFFCFLVTFLVQNWLLVFAHENVTAYIVEMAILLVVNIIAQMWKDRHLLWDLFQTSKMNESLLSEIREVFRSTDVKTTEFDWDTIITGTNNFSNSNVVGVGEGSTTTTIYYKAVLQPSKDLVVVQRFSESCFGQEGVDEFMGEISLLPKLDHPNIIKLTGYCIHGKENLLVYESVQVASNLDSLLLVSSMFKDQLKLFYLNQWSVRFKIIIGIAEGVAYLHDYSVTRVVHGDLKLRNIMLDSEKNPKIFGFASARSTTPGNMSEEHKLQMKSDIYRFGVIVLVMMSGTRVTTDSDIASLIDHARVVRRIGAVVGMVEDTIMTTYVPDEAQRCLIVGLLCTQEDPNSRPSMTSVLEILHGVLGSNAPFLLDTYTMET